MATKKKGSKKKAAGKKTSGKKGTALVPFRSISELQLPGDWESELAEYVERDAASATGGTGWEFMSTQGGKFKYGGEDIGNELDVVIVGACRVNAYYDGPFDPSNPTGPKCFALDTDQNESLMSPPADLKTKENGSCEDCWANAFGSAATGRGKACKNGVRLCVLPYDEGETNFEKVEGARINIPPTSLKAWTAYASKVTKGVRRPLFTVVTKVRIVGDPRTQFVFEFEPVGAIQDEETLRTIKTRVDGEALLNLYAEPQTGSSEDEKPKRAKTRKTAKAQAKAKKRTRKAG